MKKEFKKNTDKLLEINLNIKALFSTGFGTQTSDAGDDDIADYHTEIEKLLSEKDSLIEKLRKLKMRSPQEFSELKVQEFSEIWEKICELEAENLDVMQKLQNAISVELFENKFHSKVISSYRFTKEIQPRLFDDSL